MDIGRRVRSRSPRDSLQRVVDIVAKLKGVKSVVVLGGKARLKKERVSIRDICDFLNETLKTDYDCVAALVGYRVKKAKDIVVCDDEKQMKYDVFGREGLVGFVNEHFSGMGICVEEDKKSGKIIEFREVGLRAGGETYILEE